jgi:Protein of unknown function (DUF2442)
MIGMSTLLNEIRLARAKGLPVTDDSLTIVDRTVGRTISMPQAWYPRLIHAAPEERSRWQLIMINQGIHWPGVDEDLTVEGLLLCNISGESQRSLQKWPGR